MQDGIEKESVWIDLDKFMFRVGDEFGSQDILGLSETLKIMANHLAYVSQFEPDLKRKENEIKNQIEMEEKNLNIEISARLDSNFDNIPAIKRKNKELMLGWLYNNDPYIKEKIKEIDALRKDLLKASYDYNRYTRRMNTGKINIDVGRTVISALKAEMSLTQ